MHINIHFAVGIIFASILHYFFHFNIFKFSLIVLFSFICDFDIFFSKFAIDQNHRMLITHSLIPSVVILFIGILINWVTLIFCGVSYLIHIIMDALDWGTNLFYFQKKQVGLKLMISKEEFENLSEHLSNFKNPSSFFDQKYYRNKICLGFEVLIFILMILFTVLYAFQFILLTLFYFPFLALHLSRHFHLKKNESGNERTNL